MHASERGGTMDFATAVRLCALNDRFYRENASAFSATRSAPWQGWSRCLDVARAELGAACGTDVRDLAPERAPAQCCHGTDAPLRVLDLACGNLRFAEFLARELSDVPVSYLGVDDCEELAGASSAGAVPEAERLEGRAVAGARDAAIARSNEIGFKRLDVLGCLAQAGKTGAGSPEAGAVALRRALAAACGDLPVDAAVCFGFMHHIPLPEWRRAVVRALAESVRPGGVVCVSFWRFLDDGRLARKAAEATERAKKTPGLARLAEGFEEGDRFLGWQDRLDSFRYCHHFSDEEIDALVGSVRGKARETARFRADGRSGALNEYVVLRKEDRAF